MTYLEPLVAAGCLLDSTSSAPQMRFVPGARHSKRLSRLGRGSAHKGQHGRAPLGARPPRDGRKEAAPDHAKVEVYCRGMTVSTRVRWVRNSSMKPRRKAAVASLVTSPCSVKTSGEYWM